MKPLKVIAKYRDGRMVRGTTNNFGPGCASFHVIPLDGRPSRPVEVCVPELKAMFVVRDLHGNPRRPKQSRFLPNSPAPYGKKLEVTFVDGEVIEGVSLNYDPEAQGFFLHPADTNGNNLRIYVVNDAVKGVRFL